ncbi:MAG TPA: LacI family DNA-binding transcriptional regulator [Armatimonadaceae bacterium]|nr:LacI family DNA-binding transcriptional regulator [Armatimonadaceae bacterium]
MKPTLREIARQARVHQSTASCVLNGSGGSTRVSAETRQRVLDIARQLGYTANRAAQQLRTRRSQVIGLLVGELENPFFARLVSLCTAELEKAGYESVLAMRRQNEVSDLHLLQTLASRQVDGLLIWSESITEIRQWLEAAPRTPNAVVLGYELPGCDTVAAALDGGVRAAMQHLIDQGYQRIGYLAPDYAMHSVGDPRADVYRESLRAAGRPPYLYPYGGASHTPEAARVRAEEIACQRPEERPDALLCFNDMTAVGALMGLRRKGLRVPYDIALVGCDDLPIVSQMDVPITSIAYPLEEICRTAVAMLLDRLDSDRIQGGDIPPRYRLLPTTLSVRESSGDSSVPTLTPPDEGAGRS